MSASVVSTLTKVVKGDPARRNFGEFFEYASVKRHTEDLDRLIRLHEIRIDHEQADEFVLAACKEFDLVLPTMHYTARTDLGRYYPERWLQQEWARHVIVVRPYHLPVWLLCHEFAHHWTYLRCEGADGWHGFDFTVRLDRMAEFAESWFGA